ncbi:hypothetical protein BDZ97DRAFT_187364 [Flammula alnicola]|nr:hypothetical protein BDZ97DRAFT_187364 [Flammula alnicola]
MLRVQTHDPIIQWIPPEIASQIFTFCVPNSPYTTSKEKLAPLILGAVCKSWRAVAWSTPQLWIILSININHPDIAVKTELTKQCIARSGQLPLTTFLF